MGAKNEQLGTLISSNKPVSDERFPYYLLEEMHSPLFQLLALFDGKPMKLLDNS